MSSNAVRESFTRRGPRWDTTTKAITALVAVALFGLAVYTFRIVFIPLIIGAITAYLFQPVVRFIRRYTRLPHSIATGLLYLSLWALIIPLAIALAPVIVRQGEFLRDETIRFLADVEEVGGDAGDSFNILGIEFSTRTVLSQIIDATTQRIQSAPIESITLVFDAAEIALLTIFTLLIGFYLTRDAEQILLWLKGLVPPDYRDDVSRLMAEIDGVWSDFLRGQFILAIIVAIILTILSAGLGLPQPILLGVLGGVLEFLPSVGHTIWIIIALILALVDGSSWLPIENNLIFALLVAGAHFAFAQFDLNYLIPRIIGTHVKLHPMVVIIGIILGAVVGGVLGVALAAPTIATLRIVGRYVYRMMFDLDPFAHFPPPEPTAPALAGAESTQQAAQTSTKKPARSRAAPK